MVAFEIGHNKNRLNKKGKGVGLSLLLSLWSKQIVTH